MWATKKARLQSKSKEDGDKDIYEDKDKDIYEDKDKDIYEDKDKDKDKDKKDNNSSSEIEEDVSPKPKSISIVNSVDSEAVNSDIDCIIDSRPKRNPRKGVLMKLLFGTKKMPTKTKKSWSSEEFGNGMTSQGDDLNQENPALPFQASMTEADALQKRVLELESEKAQLRTENTGLQLELLRSKDEVDHWQCLCKQLLLDQADLQRQLENMNLDLR